jgi:hypothetical protein
VKTLQRVNNSGGHQTDKRIKRIYDTGTARVRKRTSKKFEH